MKRARFLRLAGLDQIHTGGRWHRILRALDSQPMTTDQLFDATDPGKHVAAVERRKIKVALRDMTALDLVHKAAGWGWASTADGRRTLTEMDQQLERATGFSTPAADLRMSA